MFINKSRSHQSVTKMAEDEDDGTWVLDLDAALLEENCSAKEVYSVCQGREFPANVRAEGWQACLGVRAQNSRLHAFPDIFDLPEQAELRADCQAAAERLGNDEADKVSVLSDMESVVTCYCKTHNVKYSPGWVDILLPILALKRPRVETYDIFEALLERLVPRNCEDIYHVLRLLILYHAPELCSFLDNNRITPDMFAKNWFTTLFSGVCDLKVVHAIWDFYLQQNDPFFVFFLTLVIAVNGQEHVLRLRDEPKAKIVDSLSLMASALEHKDVKDLCALAVYYVLKTPKSFKKDLEDLLFGRGEETGTLLSQALCLPVSASELVQNASEVDLGDDVEKVRFFLVDCRPAEQYNAGHLSTAFHLDCNLMLQEPAAFSMAVQGLLSAQKQALAANSHAGGQHLCFLGSGRDEEDQYTHMVVASFLQKHIQYVSMVSGGYEAIHEYFGQDMSDCLEDHDDRQCLVCRDSAPAQSSPVPQHPSNSDILGKLSAAMKIKGADLKDKLIEYIVNPSASSDNLKGKNKLYRGVRPVFSIDEDENIPDSIYEDVEEEELQQNVPLSQFIQDANTIASWRCQQVKENGYVFDSLLVLTKTHLVVLRELSGRKGRALLVVKRSLASIVKITAKKSHPDLITFKYGNPGSAAYCDMDRFIIPKASEVTKRIAEQVVGTDKADLC